MAEQARAEWAATRLADRFRAHLGQVLTCEYSDGQRLTGAVLDVGADWLLLQVGRGRAVIPVAALVGVDGLTRAVSPPQGEVGRRLGLGVVLRRMAVQRVAVRLVVHGGAMLTGTIDRVAADHLDLATHPDDAPRRAMAVASVRAVPLAALTGIHISTL